MLLNKTFLLKILILRDFSHYGIPNLNSLQYNSSIKNDPTFGYGYRPIGWIPISGFTVR